MKIVSWNVNGLRAIYKRNFLKWLKKINVDIICLQEIRVQLEQVPEDLIKLRGHDSYFNFAKKKGYSGVAVYAKQKPKRIDYKLGLKRFDQEGRILKVGYSDFDLINFYFPHGRHDKKNLGYKLKAYDCLINYLKKVKNKKIILIGDFNIAHQEIDLARPKDNKNNIMFTPEERKQIDRIIDLGFTDSFRKFNQKGEYYTWWPYGFNARERTRSSFTNRRPRRDSTR